MKLAAITLTLLTCWFSIACTSAPATITITSPDGTTVSATGAKKLGGKAFAIAKNKDTIVAIGDDNEDSFREGNKTVRTGLLTWGATNIFSSGAEAYKSVKNAKTAADVSKTGLIENTKVLGAQEITKQKALDIEALALGVAE